MQVGKVLIAAGEQAAERREGKITGLGLGRCPCGPHEGVKDRSGEDICGEIGVAGEWRTGMEVDREETAQMLGLRGARGVRRRKCRAGC